MISIILLSLAPLAILLALIFERGDLDGLVDIGYSDKVAYLDGELDE